MDTLKKKQFSVTLDEDLIEEIKAVAEECDRPFSQYVNLVLRDYLKKQKETPQN